MKKKYIIFIIVFAIIIGCSITFSYFMKNSTKENIEKISVDGIENFRPITEKDTYLLYYPADSRVSQENTLIKEVKKTGDVVREYEIKDKDFHRMNIHQKPNDIDQLFISSFGEPTIDNFYFLYDIQTKKFKKINLDYFNYDVGVDHIMHYGEDILFQTIVSHKTGEQNVNSNNDFNVSVSDYTKKKSFETQYGNAPKWTALLGFDDKIIYGTSSKVDETEVFKDSGIGIVDLKNQTVKYLSPIKDEELTPIYATEDHAYVLDNYGKMYVYDKSFGYKVYEPFKDMSREDEFYNEENKPLLIDKNRALYSVYSQNNGTIIGIMTFEPKPSFQSLKKDYLEPEYSYRFLYQDRVENEIYIVKYNEEKESILVIDQDFNFKTEIPIKHSHLLDFIVKN